MAELNSSPEKSGGKQVSKKMPVRVDLTAMVDLAFLLITFFMLTTTLAKPRAMPIVMPVNTTVDAVPASRTMTLCLGKNNQVLWYMGMADHPLTTPALTGYGKNIRNMIMERGKKVLAATGKEMIVLVKPAEHSVYSNLVDAIDELSIAKVSTYAISDISARDIELLRQKQVY